MSKLNQTHNIRKTRSQLIIENNNSAEKARKLYNRAEKLFKKILPLQSFDYNDKLVKQANSLLETAGKYIVEEWKLTPQEKKLHKILEAEYQRIVGLSKLINGFHQDIVFAQKNNSWFIRIDIK